MTRRRRPSDLGNDSFAIRTSTGGQMTEAKMRDKPYLTEPEGRKVARRFAERILDLCDWFEGN